jgi:hypothetical protein
MKAIKRERGTAAEWRYWVERAEEARTMAEGFDDPRARRTMIGIADEYDHVATALKPTERPSNREQVQQIMSAAEKLTDPVAGREMSDMAATSERPANRRPSRPTYLRERSQQEIGLDSGFRPSPPSAYARRRRRPSAPTRYNDPPYWQQRADEARQLAEDLRDEEARKQMINVAEGYERLAMMAEQRILGIP